MLHLTNQQWLQFANIAYKCCHAVLLQYNGRRYYRPIFEVQKIRLWPYMVKTGSQLSLYKCLLNAKFCAKYKLKWNIQTRRQLPVSPKLRFKAWTYYIRIYIALLFLKCNYIASIKHLWLIIYFSVIFHLPNCVFSYICKI